MITFLFRHLRGLCILCFASVAPPAMAEARDAISGAETPEYQEALAAWLEADEAEALPRLAELAESGNLAAQVLLGLIDKSAALQGPHVTYLPREERIALLRQAGGLSGRNWMTTAATESDLARLWVELWMMQGGVELAQGFAELGEERACRESLLAHVSRQERGFAPEVRAANWFPESLRHLTLGRALEPAEGEALPEGHPMRSLAGLEVTPEALAGWLAIDPLAAPLREVCDTNCSETSRDCTLALYEALGSYHSLALMGSPAVALIPEAEFIASPRGHQAVARRIMLMHATRRRESMLHEVAEIDACSADWLREQYEVYKPVRRIPPVSLD